MTGYDFHPEAALDLDEIWEFIAGDNLDAARAAFFSLTILPR
jgi:plasmid stabilization system protein ParE